MRSKAKEQQPTTKTHTTQIPDFAKVFPGVDDPRRCLKLKMGRSAAVHLEFASEMAVLKWVNGISDVMSELLNTALVAVDGAACMLQTHTKHTRHTKTTKHALSTH